MDTTLTVQPSATAPGLLLRPWAEHDIPAMVAAHRDPVIRRWLRHPVTTAEEAHRIIQARRGDRRAGIGFSFAVLQTDPDGTAGNLVGAISIRRLDDEATSGEVGYWVTAPWRGRGIAPRALSAVCEWAFLLPRLRPLEQLELVHSVGNHASCRVADKAGFALSAVLPPLLPEFPDDGHLHIRPRAHDLADLDPKIEMQRRRVVELHYKAGHRHGATLQSGPGARIIGTAALLRGVPLRAPEPLHPGNDGTGCRPTG